MQNRAIRVLVINHHEHIHFSLIFFLEVTGEFELLGEAPDAEAGLILCAHLQPDVVIVAVGQADTDGLNLIGQITACAPTPGIILIGSDITEADRAALIQAGVSHYLTKHASVVELEAALHAVAPPPLAEPCGWP